MSIQVNDDYPNKSQASKLTDEQLKQIAIEKYNSSQVDEVRSYNFPTEIIELPSKGILYPKGHPLKSGKIEMKYMSAKEEDILSNQSFIKNGVVLDKLFKSLIVTPCEYNDLLICDKNAVMIAARILGYGKDYPVKVKHPETGEEIEYVADLTQLKEKEIDWSLITDGVNEFEFTLPVSKCPITLKILTQAEQRKIDEELKGLAKLKRDANVSTMMKHLILKINGESDNAKIRKFVDTELLAIDSRAIRQFLKTVTPEIDLSIDVPDGDSGATFHCSLPVGLDLFWPDAKL